MISPAAIRWRGSRKSGLLSSPALIAIITLVIYCGVGTTAFQVVDDAIIIEVNPAKENTEQSAKDSSGANSRIKRQLGYPGGIGGGVFPPGWPFNPAGSNPVSVGGSQFPQFPGINIHQHLQPFQPTQSPTSAPPPPKAPLGGCRTNNGIYGYCASFRQCYPILYSPDDGHIMNNGLAERYMNISGPCNGPETSNIFMFRTDARLRQNHICCGGSIAAQQPSFPNFPLGQFPIHNFPQLTMRPPWAFQTTKATTPSTTSTTTTRRTTTTTTPRPQWGGWPPKQSTTTTTARTTTTTRSPWNQWTQWTQWTQRTTASTTARTTTTTRRPFTPSTTTSPPVSSSCGQSHIIGGSQAVKGEFPWLVALVRNGRQVCGGSLIDSVTVLTASHCFNGVTSHELQTLFKVYIGDYDLHVLTDGPMTVKSISKLILHRQFHQQYFYNDIALLKLDSPVQFGNNGNNGIAPICLSTGGPYEGDTAVVAGWGRTNPQSAYQPGAYRKVELKVWSLQQCANTYGSLAPGGITSQMMCAGLTNKDSCLGDSGGPLQRKVGGRWEQIGLVSWGIGCGTYPGVYTKIADYQDWIARHRTR